METKQLQAKGTFLEKWVYLITHTDPPHTPCLKPEAAKVGYPLQNSPLALFLMFPLLAVRPHNLVYLPHSHIQTQTNKDTTFHLM